MANYPLNFIIKHDFYSIFHNEACVNRKHHNVYLKITF